MPFGILDGHKLDSVPGTGILSSTDAQLTTGDATGLKRGTGKHSDVVLLPQPSDDPCDPLNWPRWRKETCFWTLVFMTGLADTLLLLTTPGYFLLAKEFDVSVNAVASSFSTVFVGLSAFMLLLVPISVKYGYHKIYLCSAFLMFMTCVWAALSPNLTSIRIARIFQGFGVAATRCLVANTIEHLFFVHERGMRSSIWTLCQAIGEIMGVLINGYIIQLLSWRHGFWFAGIACGLCFICVLLFVPETTYRRNEASSKQESTGENSKINIESEKAELEMVPRTPSPGKLNVDPNPLSPNSPSGISYLKTYNGTFSDESMLRIFLGLFPFILSPVTWFSFLSASIPSVLFLVVSSCSSTIFTLTYGFNAGQIGLTNAGAIVGMVVALLTAGPLHDWWIVWMARRNRGIYEPEFRLLFTFSLVIGALSYMGWAIGNDNHMPWIGAVACVAINNFTISVATATRVAYVIDAHGANAAHILTLTESVMYLITYSATFFANGIVLSAGVRRTLLVVAAIQAACWLTCVPMYVFGKRVRSFIARHPRLFRGDVLALAATPTPT